jgi:hypothetical protein
MFGRLSDRRIAGIMEPSGRQSAALESELRAAYETKVAARRLGVYHGNAQGQPALISVRNLQ